MVKYVNILFGIILTTNVGVQAATSQQIKAKSISIINKYASAAAVKMNLTKEDAKKTLGTKTSVTGELYFSKGKIFYGVAKPNQVEIIYNEKVWLIEYPDLDFDKDGKRKVTVFTPDKILFIKKMSDLLNKPEKFLAKDAVFTEKENSAHIEIKNLKNQAVKSLHVIINLKEQLISEIQFIDDVDTETKISFLKTEFLKNVPKGRFTYKKLKTDEIMKP